MLFKNYQSLKLAKKAVRRLNIKSMTEYHLRKHEDPKLPSNPSEFYSRKGWKSSNYFLGITKKEYYKSYNDAQIAVQELGIKKRIQYKDKKGYKRDSKLPSDPEEFYKNNGWIDWDHFLGIEKISFYSTYEEAKKAVTKLGIKTRKEYRKEKAYKKNKRLPSAPDEKYKNIDWNGWNSFLDGKI